MFFQRTAIMLSVIPVAQLPRVPTPPVLATMCEESELRKHMNVIARLAEELCLPVAQIEPLYSEILAGLRSQARIRDYLPILVSKALKDLLRNPS
jgi:hypothetical protein